MHARSARLRASAALVLAGCGLSLTVVAAALERANWSLRIPGDPWTASQSATWATAVLSCVLLVTIGAWLGWRLERNPVGWWLGGAGIAFAGWVAALFWEHRAGTWITLLLPSVFRVLVVLAVLGWPTGRFEPRWRRPLAWVLGLYTAVGVVSAFVGAEPATVPPWGHADWALPAVGGVEIGSLRLAVEGIVYLAIAPTALIVAVARRRSRLPAVLRSISTPAYAAAWVLAFADYWIFVSNVLGGQLEVLDGGGTTVLGTVRAVVDYGRFGAVPVLLLVGEHIRHRVLSGRDDAPGTIDLDEVQGPEPLGPEIDELVGGPARILYRRPDGEWVTGDGVTVPLGPAAHSVRFGDADGTTIAALEVPGSVPLAPTSVEAVASSVGVEIVRARRTAEASARLVELRELQRLLLERQDDARRRLERDLHDGVQQRLVALTLEVAMAERRAVRGGPPPDRLELAGALRTTASDVRELVDREQPAVLDAGLAGGLAALAASAAVPCDLAVRGDLPAEDPATRILWFAASEAVGNALKHAGAGRLRIDLHVGPGDTVLTVTDDGRGGVQEPPAAIVDRVRPCGGVVDVSTPDSGGTRVVVTVPSSVLVAP